jgi:hypothetical protein
MVSVNANLLRMQIRCACRRKEMTTRRIQDCYLDTTFPSHPTSPCSDLMSSPVDQRAFRIARGLVSGAVTPAMLVDAVCRVVRRCGVPSLSKGVTEGTSSCQANGTMSRFSRLHCYFEIDYITGGLYPATRVRRGRGGAGSAPTVWVSAVQCGG